MNEDLIFIEQLTTKLQGSLPGVVAHRKMIPEGRAFPYIIPDNAIKSAVMILLYDLDNQWNTVLIRRTKDGQTHSGQISFPGGKMETSDKNLNHTALRECEEEIGIPMSDIQPIGTLSNVYIPPSNFIVTPTIGYIKNMRQFKASKNEVQEIIQLPLELLFQKNIKLVQEVRSNHNPKMPIKTPTYTLAEDLIVWGATAMMIAELEDVILSI